jgi:hypothetical protein
MSVFSTLLSVIQTLKASPQHVPKRDIPRRRLSTMLERIGVELGLKGKHSRAGYTSTY